MKAGAAVKGARCFGVRLLWAPVIYLCDDKICFRWRRQIFLFLEMRNEYVTGKEFND